MMSRELRCPWPGMYIGGVGYHVTDIVEMRGPEALTFALQVSQVPVRAQLPAN